MKKFHNITVEELLEREDEDILQSGEWFTKYTVTQQQHDQWYEWFLDTMSKHFGIPKDKVAQALIFEYLNCAPTVKGDE